jgi:hypothetical protein
MGGRSPTMMMSMTTRIKNEYQFQETIYEHNLPSISTICLQMRKEFLSEKNSQ